MSAIAVDPTGSRVLTGGYDYVVRMYDFQGMDSRLRSFRQVEPSEGHQIRALSWSPTADQFLAVTGSAQAKIYDRDGFTLGEFVKGDMYIRDLKNTKGHISGLTGGHWHPKDRETALTSSEDGSLRIWDVTNFKTQKQVSILKDSEQSFITSIPKVDSGFMVFSFVVHSFILQIRILSFPVAFRNAEEIQDTKLFRILCTKFLAYYWSLYTPSWQRMNLVLSNSSYSLPLFVKVMCFDAL